MIRKLLLSSSLLLIACGTGAPKSTPTIPIGKGTATLTIELKDVTPVKGHLGCALFNSADGFPGTSPLIGGGTYEPVTSETHRCTFKDLPAGTWAVSTFHDVNDNGEFDSNVVGAPTEPYGATNNRYYATRAPKFEESTVTLTEGQQLSATIEMRKP